MKKEIEEEIMTNQITRIPFIEFIEQIEEFHGDFDLNLIFDALRSAKIKFNVWWDEDFTKHLEIYIKKMGLQNRDIVILDELNDGYDVLNGLSISHMIIDVQNISLLYRLVSRVFNLRAFL